MGPNTLSGHLSVLYTTECQINFIVRVIRPILKGNNYSLLPSPFNTSSGCADSVAVTPVAERKYVATTDAKAKSLVWATGCTSWFIDSSTGRNTIMFPDWQSKFYLGSVFIQWRDLVYKKSFGKYGSSREVTLDPGLQSPLLFAAKNALMVGALLGVLMTVGGFDSSSKFVSLKQYLRF